MKGMKPGVPGHVAPQGTGLTRAEACGTGNFPTTPDECDTAWRNNQNSEYTSTWNPDNEVSIGNWDEVTGCNVFHGGGTASRRTWQWNNKGLNDEHLHGYMCDFSKSLGCVCDKKIDCNP
tara:strand:+ start:78 stop:437 length:360 start_codon:yes stop_codon:yes gene_type:complete